MSGIGHLAVGFAAKPASLKIPLWVFLVAAETNEILYFLFTSIGLEQKAVMTMNFSQGVKYLAPIVEPLVARVVHVCRVVSRRGSDRPPVLQGLAQRSPAWSGGFQSLAARLPDAFKSAFVLRWFTSGWSWSGKLRSWICVHDHLRPCHPCCWNCHLLPGEKSSCSGNEKMKFSQSVPSARG